jgi:phage FluMu protein Com
VPIHFRCPHCDNLLAIGTRKAGTQIHCPMCDRIVTVPPRTSLDVPTTTVAPADTGQEWWLEAPETPQKTTAADPPPNAWWTTPNAPPGSSVAPESAPASVNLPSAPPSPPASPLVFDSPKSDDFASTKPKASTNRSFPLGMILIIAFCLLLASIGLLLWLNSGQLPPSTEGTPSNGEVPEGSNRSKENQGPAIPSKERKPLASSSVSDKNTVKTRLAVTEELLRRQAAAFPEVSLDRGRDRTEAQNLFRLAEADAREGKRTEEGLRRLRQRADLMGLPFCVGDANRLTADKANHLHESSLALRARLFAVTEGGTKPLDAQKLRTALDSAVEGNKWQRPEAIPALQQTLMAEDAAVRQVLVQQLDRIADSRAAAMLARIALFDLDADVRRCAVSALSKRPRREYRNVVLEGFEYPWLAVVDHAAETIVALKMRDAAPELANLLGRSDPRVPYKKAGKEEWLVREVVRVNHLNNCMLCHAPSLTERDKPRGFMPSPELPPPRPFTREYYANRRPGLFVRADVTYLRQDFSVPLPVENAGKWPAIQRFDFLLRERPATSAEAEVSSSESNAEYHQALLFALRELTGADAGESAADWQQWLKRSP